MKAIKYLPILFIVILFACVGKPAISGTENPDSVTSDCLSDDISEQDAPEQDIGKIDFSGEGEFLRLDPSMWPKN